MANQELIPHLFRTEYRKIVSVLFRYFGFDEMETAEDIASDTFLTATQSWPVNGIPENPVAWLHYVAKNKARNLLRREIIFQNKISSHLRNETANENIPEIDLSPQNIRDSQLQMIFAICDPGIAADAQIGLALRILCGFGIDEIANAFLTNKETINKRLFRAKEKLRDKKIAIELPHPTEIEIRLDNVLRTIYLLFNEGYYSISKQQAINKELCEEAMRLCTMLTENESTNLPPVNALLALMCFHSSRIDARMDSNGDLILFDDQDTSLWNRELVLQGAYYLNKGATGNKLSRYHLEAAIAYWHTQTNDTNEKWEKILQLYNYLLQIEYSPIAALNRTFALSKANGKAAAIIEAEKLQLTNNHFYFMLLGDLYSAYDNNKAKDYFMQALKLAKTITDKNTINKRLESL